MLRIVRQILSIIKRSIYTNETIIYFEHKKNRTQTSAAIIKKCTLDNVYDILSFQSPYYVELFKKFIKQGHVGYLAYMNDICVHRQWIVSFPYKTYAHWALPVFLKKDEMWIQYAETAVSARGNNICAAVICKMLKDFPQAKKIMCSANAKNLSSIKAIEKAGFVAIKKIKIMVLLAIKYKIHYS